MYSFENISVGTIVPVLDYQATWSFILKKDGSVFRFPLEKLKKVQPVRDASVLNDSPSMLKQIENPVASASLLAKIKSPSIASPVP
eukprot:Awhi_evm1s1489